MCVGWPGSVHDARVFAHSALCSDVENNQILPNQTTTIFGTHNPLYVIGDFSIPFEIMANESYPSQYSY